MTSTLSNETVPDWGLRPTEVGGWSRLGRWVLALAAVAGAVGVGMEVAGVHFHAREILVLLFLAEVPTVAIAGLLRTLDAFARLVIAGAANIVVLTLTASIMLAEGVWSPAAGLLVVAAISLVCLVPQFPPVRRRMATTAAAWRTTKLDRVSTNGSAESLGGLLGAGTGASSSHNGVASVVNESNIAKGLRVLLEGKEYQVEQFGQGKATVKRGEVRTKVPFDKLVVIPDELDDDPAAAAERREAELAARSSVPSSWSPAGQGQLGQIFRDAERPTQPTVFSRDDGVALLYPGRINMFMGEPEGCKTWASLVAVAQEVTNGNAACVVDFSDSPETTIGRLRQLGLTEEQITEGVIYCAPDSPFDHVAEAHLELSFRTARNSSSRELTLAVVDSVTEAMAVEGLDPDVGRDVVTFYRGLPRWLKDQGAAVVLIDHIFKSRESRGRWAFGSERKMSGLDGAAYGFKETAIFGRGVTGRVKVLLTKDRGGFMRQHAPGQVVGTLTLASSPEDGSVTASFTSPTAEALDEQARTLEDLRVRMARAITEHPGSTSTDLRGLVEGANGAAKNETLRWLVDNGYSRHEKSGRQTVFYSVKAYESD